MILFFLDTRLTAVLITPFYIISHTTEERRRRSKATTTTTTNWFILWFYSHFCLLHFQTIYKAFEILIFDIYLFDFSVREKQRIGNKNEKRREITSKRKNNKFQHGKYLLKFSHSNNWYMNFIHQYHIIKNNTWDTSSKYFSFLSLSLSESNTQNLYVYLLYSIIYKYFIGLCQTELFVCIHVSWLLCILIIVCDLSFSFICDSKLIHRLASLSFNGSFNT